MQLSSRIALFAGLLFIGTGFAASAQAAHLGHGYFGPVTEDLPATGYLSIDNDAGPMVVSFDEDFAVVPAEDLRVLIHDQASPTDFQENHYEDLGPLTSATGAQAYPLPEGTKLKQFKSIVIYSPSSGLSYSLAKLTIHID